MAAAKKPKDVPPKAAEDEDVLFEGELTWTHDPVPKSPELLQRTPRTAGDDAERHDLPPGEGLVDLHEVKDGGGEIFAVEHDVPDEDETPADEPEASGNEADEVISDEAVEPPAETTEDKVPAEEAAPAEAPAKPAKGGRTAHAAGGAHGRTVMPLNGFNKTRAAEGDPFSNDTAGSVSPADRSRGNGPVASQFAIPDDPESEQHAKARKLIIIGAVVGVVLAVVAAICIYVFTIMPNRPANILNQALSNTLGEHSVSFDLQASEQDATRRSLMTLSAQGAISQVGSFDMAARLTNPDTPTPFVMAARSLNGLDTYVQGTALAADAGYLNKLGMPGTATPALQQLDGKWITIPAAQRSNVFTGLGLDGSANPSISSTDKSKLATLYATYPFMTVASQLPEASIDGAASYHYLISFDKTQLTAFAIAARDQIKTLGITQTQIDAINKLDTGSLRLEVWIDHASRHIVQVSLAKQKASSTVTWQVKLAKFGETIPLQQPNAAGDLNGALKQLIGNGATDDTATALLRKLLSNFSLARP